MSLRLDRLDRYVARYFLGSVAVVFVFFFGFFMVIDLFSNADEFIETAREKGIAARTMAGWVAGYYLYKAPSVFLQVAPFVTVIGGILALARLNRQNELIPMLTAGRSIFRVLKPVFVGAGALMVVMLFVQEYVAPAASDHRLALWSFLRKGTTGVAIDSQITDQRGYLWSSLRFDPIRSVLQHASIRHVDETKVEILDLEEASYDGARHLWTSPRGVKLLEYDDATGQRERTLDGFESSVTPRQITAGAKEPFDLSFAELGALFGRTKQARFQVLLHYHITFPITNLLLLLLALPFVVRYDRQRVMHGLAIAFLLCIAYFGVDSALRSLGEQRLHPVLAAWFTPLFFGALGISLFDGMKS